MGSLSLRKLILSASLATLATLAVTTSATPTGQKGGLDACGSLGAKNVTDITYDDVSACYKAIPFDRNASASTLQTVYELFNDYYIFRDSALTPNLKAPFSSAPVDIVKKLQKIARTKYSNDYSFHTDISNAIATLHDAHAGYSVNCYNAYLFAQPLNLYAPVISGKQALRVFKDLAGRGYEDCEVVTIDGEEAISYMENFATTLGFSKDGGVRMNQALANQIYDHASESFILSSGDYAERATLPGSAYVDYELKCLNSDSTIKIRDNWRVLSLNQATFTDVNSYLANVCLPAPASSNVQKRELTHPVKRRLFPTPKKSALLDAVSAPPANTSTGDFPGAEKLGAGNATVYYHLKNEPDVGVIVVFTHEAEDGELDVALQALDTFHKLGVTKLIIDFQGNGGGSVAFASFLVQIFFPNKGPLDKSLRSNLRIDASIQDLSKAVFNISDAGLYNAAQYIDFKTQALYTNDDLFLNPVTLTRNGRKAQYSASTTLGPQTLPEIEQLATYPWTNNPESIRILSDGRCGSACALSCQYLHATYKVSAFSIGGIQDQELSTFSFAGGAVSALSNLNQVYALGNMTSPLGNLPYKGDVRLPILEVFAENSQVPLEYDYTQYAAKVHIDFDAENARSRDIMWSQVAVAAWK